MKDVNYTNSLIKVCVYQTNKISLMSGAKPKIGISRLLCLSDIRRKVFIFYAACFLFTAEIIWKKSFPKFATILFRIQNISFKDNFIQSIKFFVIFYEPNSSQFNHRCFRQRTARANVRHRSPQNGLSRPYFFA